VKSNGDILVRRRQQGKMSDAWKFIVGDSATHMLIIGDHASNHVPSDVDLGIDPALLETHIAVDIGVADLAVALAARMEIPAILGGVSRLVVDLNREVDAPHIIPITSDGHPIPGNAVSYEVRANRIDRFWQPYHDKISQLIEEYHPKLLISLHSFTPQLASDPAQLRPWQVGVLYNDDARAARIAIPLLEAAGVIVGDQLPYSGKRLNASMNLHGEARGIAYLGLEMRQDLIGDADGIARWADIVIPVIAQVVAGVGRLHSPSQSKGAP
jgi:predicted N-formylglutamate amidohydrolase